MIHVPKFLKRVRPLNRWATSLLSRYARWTMGRFLVQRRDNLTFLIDQQNAIDKRMLINGEWEEKQLSTLRQMIACQKQKPEEKVFLDIGAHGALYAMKMAQSGMFSRVIAFEADAVNAAQLKANLFLNDLVNKIEVVEAAVSDKDGQAPLHIPENYYRGGSRIDLDGNLNRISHTKSVNTIALDSCFTFEGLTVVAKIDVEGHEHQVIRGMQKLLRRNTWLIQIESFDKKYAETHRLLSEAGLVKVGAVEYDHYFSSPELVRIESEIGSL